MNFHLTYVGGRGHRGGHNANNHAMHPRFQYPRPVAGAEISQPGPVKLLAQDGKPLTPEGRKLMERMRASLH